MPSAPQVLAAKLTEECAKQGLAIKNMQDIPHGRGAGCELRPGPSV